MIIASRYEATGAAAWGGFSEVHRFRDLHLNRDVMLKRMRNAAHLPRLLDEQKALLSLRSNHVVELLDVVTYDYNGERETGLVLEYIDGADLQEGAFVVNDGYVKTLWQVASGLSDIHGAGVIHRDIKPPNLRKDAFSVIKIIDFGLSRQVGVDDSTRSVIGSFGYLAPELSGPGVKQIGMAADVFAFGATAVSLIQPVAQQQGRLTPQLVASVLTGAHPTVIDIITRCTAPLATNRPDIITVRDTLAGLLVVGQHRAWLNQNGKVIEINARSPQATLRTTVGTLEIRYDGQSFIVQSVTGVVALNNLPVQQGQRLFSSGIIAFGSEDTPGRGFVTFDVSNPEVVA